MRPPQWFVKALGILDPLLSVRRSVVTSHWVIERNAVILESEVATIIRRRDRMWKWINFPTNPRKNRFTRIEKNGRA